MRIFKDPVHKVMDGVCEPDEFVQVEVTHDITGGYKLYVHVNGVTILRLGSCMKGVGFDSVAQTHE